MKEDSIRQIMNAYDHLNVALVGIGTADNTSSAFRSGYYSDEMKQQAVKDRYAEISACISSIKKGELIASRIISRSSV